MNDNTPTKRIIVTGSNGFVGKHLVRELHSHGHTVVGVGSQAEPAAEIASLLSEYISADLSASWPEALTGDAIIHLAGLAVVGESFDRPQDYIGVNSSIMTNMAEFYLKSEVSPRIIVVSSGALYDPSQPMPLTEDSKLSYNSPYAVSKALVENQCTYYQKRGLDCVVVRPFNHIGPGQTEGFLIPDVIAQLKTKDAVTVGNISTRRDFTDVRDIVRAYRLLVEATNLQHTLYNACSGVSKSGKEVVELLKEICEKPDAEIVIDQSKVRPTDAPEIYGDSSALQADTGWKPAIELRQTLEDCVGAVS